MIQKPVLPIEFQSKYYNVWDPTKLDAEHKVIVHNTTKWKKIGTDGVCVPIEVDASWNNNDEALEGWFEFHCLFGEDIPDRIFEDPREAPVVLPKFNGLVDSQDDAEDE